MKENKINIEKYASLIHNSPESFSYLLLKKFYSKNRKHTFDLLKKLFEISVSDYINLHNSKWKTLFGQSDEVNIVMVKRMSSYIILENGKFTVTSSLIYTDETDIELTCIFYRNGNNYIIENKNFNKYLRNKKHDLLLFRIDLKSDKSFKLVKILPKPLFYQLFDEIFKED
jgi:hypothetical protein